MRSLGAEPWHRESDRKYIQLLLDEGTGMPRCTRPTCGARKIIMAHVRPGLEVSEPEMDVMRKNDVKETLYVRTAMQPNSAGIAC